MRQASAVALLLICGCGASTHAPVSAHSSVTAGCITAAEVLRARRERGRDVGGKIEELVARCDALLDTIESIVEAPDGK